jgi:hypothetical protein
MQTNPLLYNQTSGLVINICRSEYIDIRINGAAFDKSRNFWVKSENGLKVWKPMDSGSVFYSILDASEDNSFGRMLIDRNGTKWMATNRYGVNGFK